MSQRLACSTFAALTLAACAWEQGDPNVCQSYGSAWCAGNRIMWCSEGLGFFEDDRAVESEDCGERGASCLDAQSNVACVFRDRPCDGESVCVGSVPSACVGGFISTRATGTCEHGCERLAELDDVARCVQPGMCEAAGAVECSAPSARYGELARYSICVRAGWALSYMCDPDRGSYGGCSDLVVGVPCSSRPNDDADAGVERL
jgi:hypothetical protein